MNKQTIKDIDVKGKKSILSCRFNVPMKDGAITDDTRIKAALPTIDYLSKQGAKVILASHLGRPGGEVVEELRMDAVAKRLSDLTNQTVVKTDQVYGDEVNQAVSELNDGDILLIENVRFEPGETKK